MKTARQLLPLLPVPGKGASVWGSWPHFCSSDVPSSSPGGLKRSILSSSCRGVTVPGLSRPKSRSLGRARPPHGLESVISLGSPQAGCQDPAALGGSAVAGPPTVRKD